MLIKKLFILIYLGSFVYLQAQDFEAKLVYPPVATMQLGPSVFLPQSDVEKLKILEGTPVRLEINNKSTDLRLYNSFGDEHTIGLHSKILSFFEVSYGDTVIFSIKKLSEGETTLKPKPIKFFVENYKGNLDLWGGYAIGAPHGDCDRETGVIAKIISEQYGIPSTAAYGCRLSYRGIWFDCNRPLMREAKPSVKGVLPERLWNKEAEEKYNTFQDSVWSNSNLTYGKRFKLFTSFHGHDLTVTLEDGTKIQRPIIEGIGTGFTKEELIKIKKFYYRNRDKYYKDAPDLYFGNLPEDLVYEYKDIPLDFFYTGLGSRTYGTLRSDLSEHILHFETPNSMRIDPEVQPQTAKLLNDIYVFVKDSIFAKHKRHKNIASSYVAPENIGEKVWLSGGEFLFGAPKGFGWSSERPQHKVRLSPFAIDIYEVTNKQYCNFLNNALKQNLIEVKEGNVVWKENTEMILYKTSTAVPFSEIIFRDNEFVVVNSRDNFPVVFVTYYGAQKYAESLGERLPTEAEWEYAASWDGEQKFLFGNSENNFEESKANFEDTGDPFECAEVIKTTPVGFYESSSPAGCKDMSGNLWEWCSDYYKSDTHLLNKDKVVENPKGPVDGTMKVIKGGAWNTEGPVTSTTKRLGIHPNTALINLGFRCVKEGN